MQTNNKAVIITLAAVFVAAFFMPWITFFVSLSAWDMLFGEAGQYIDTGLKYIAILIPIAGVIIIYGATANNENYPVSKGILFKVPIFTLVILIVAIVSKINDSGGRIRSSDLENITKIFGIGFWLTLIAATILPFIQTKTVENKAPSLTQTNYTKKSKIGIALLIIGLILVISSTQNQFFTKKENYRVDNFGGLPDAYNIMGPMYDTRTYVDTKKKNAVLYSGIVLLIIGGFLFASGRSANNLISTKYENLTGKPPLNENQTASQTVANTNYSRPQVNINLPKVNWDNTFVKIKTFLSKYKVALLSSLGVLIAFIIVYNLFIKADPVKDAKNLAKNYCTCSEELNKNNLTFMQTYFNEFDTKKFKSRTEARNALNNILQESQTKYSNCTQSANIKYTERLADYNAKGGENSYTFQQTYSSISNACTNANSSDVAAMQNQIDEKIKNIIDPEPDVEKIKNDLLGRKILGWNFDYLNEFENMTITNKTQSNDRMEFDIMLTLLDQTKKDKHEAQIYVVYFRGDEGWYMSDVTERYITYDNVIASDNWTQITPFPNSSWSAENLHNLTWKTFEYGEEFHSGPAKPGITLPSSNSYLIKCEDGQPVNVKFTYKPNN